MKLVVIGMGQCGGRIADEFARLNRRAKSQRGIEIIVGCFAVNTDAADLSGLTGIRPDYQHRILIGGRKTHGSKFQRGLGSTGMAATPSKVHRGTKMPGRMGGGQRTVQNLRVIEVDQENGLLLVDGSVPGPRRSVVFVAPAKKK